MALGVSQLSGGSRTSVGGYVHEETPEENSAQFDVSDRRTLDEIVSWLLRLGISPASVQRVIEKVVQETVSCRW